MLVSKHIEHQRYGWIHHNDYLIGEDNVDALVVFFTFSRCVVSKSSGCAKSFCLETSAGNVKVIDQIIDDVLTPKKEMVVTWLSYRIQKIAEHNNARYRDDIKGYVDRRIEEAVEQNQEIGTINRIPIFGRQASTMIERATADIVFNVINGALEDLGSEDNRVLIEDLTDIVFDDVIHSKDSASLNKVLSDLIVQSLDVVIAKVKIKQWKHENLRENEEMLKKELRLNLKKMYEG